MAVEVSLKNSSVAQDQQSAKNLNKSFIQLFLEQVKNNPQKVIVETENGCLTYDELNRKSDGLAKYLRKIGVKTEDLVGLCSSLSSDFIVCILGIMKAGAAYFPLDPTYSKDRLQYMLKDGSPSAVLVEPQFVHLFKCDNAIRIDKKIFSSDCNVKNIYNDVLLQPENLAYVIYTSGSTGEPKGIMVTHKSLSNIALAHNAYYPSNMRMLISGGVCFDASLLVIFHALINNEALYLFNYDKKSKIDDLEKFIEDNLIEFIICVPSQYLKLLQKNHQFPFMKCVSLTGENLPRSLCSLHARLVSNALLYNEYGPTEYAIGSTIARIYDPKDRIIQHVTVGKSLPNTQVYVLDQNLNRLPKGVKGEICIGGIGLARGYLNNKALTDEKFVQVTLSGHKTIRLYRTGDIGRFLQNGELEFLGRIDCNTQICGNEVNPTEVEYHISQYPGIQESAVLVQANPKGKKQLVAYITSSKKTGSKKALLDYLRSLLPKIMVPSFVVQVKEFPLSPNGKIDRDALMCLYG